MLAKTPVQKSIKAALTGLLGFIKLLTKLAALALPPSLALEDWRYGDAHAVPWVDRRLGEARVPGHATPMKARWLGVPPIECGP